MGLLTGGLSFRRFRTIQDPPEGFRDTFLEAVKRDAHQENLKHRSKDPVFGWVSVLDPADTDFELNKMLWDPYLVVSLRVDKKAVPAKLFSILLDRRQKEVKEERGLERLGKNHKDEIKEALEEELLSQALPSVAVYDVAWHLNRAEVLLFATSDSVVEYAQGLFHDTFQQRLYPERLVDWLARTMPWEEIEERAQSYLPGGSAAGGMAHQVDSEGWHENDPLAGRELLLGTEFLTWLWQQSEESDGRFSLPEEEGQTAHSGAVTVREEEEEIDPRTGLPVEKAGASSTEDITLWFDNKLIFKDLEEERPGVTMMSGEAPSATPEAKLTLVQGKRPVEARLGFARGDYSWFFTLKALPGGLELSGLKIPAEVKEGDDEKIYERMYLIEVATSAVQRLFHRFYVERTTDGWGKGIEAWMNEEAE